MFGYDSLVRRCSCNESEQRDELRRRMLGKNSLRLPEKRQHRTYSIWSLDRDGQNALSLCIEPKKLDFLRDVLSRGSRHVATQTEQMERTEKRIQNKFRSRNGKYV